MRDYIPKDARQDLLTAYIGIEALKSYFAREQAHMTKEERQMVKTCLTYFNKFEDASHKRINDNEYRKIIRELKGATVQLVRPAFKGKGDGKMSLNVDDIHDMAAVMMEGQCRGCKLEGEWAGSCTTLRLFRFAEVPTAEGIVPEIKLRVEALDPTTVRTCDVIDGLCPYRL